jgi:hypothetical protein
MTQNVNIQNIQDNCLLLVINEYSAFEPYIQQVTIPNISI